MAEKPKKEKVKGRSGVYRAWRVKPSPGWYYVYDIRLDGRRVRTPRGLYFPTLRECDDAVASLRADLRRRVYKFPADDARVTIAEVRDLWIATLKSRRRSESYIQATARSFKLLSEVIPLSRPVRNLRTEDLAEFGRKREGNGAPLDGVRRNLAHIRYALKYAAENIPDLEDWKVPKQPEGMKGKTIGRRRTRLITREEEAAILRELRSDPATEIRLLVADAFEFALLTGMRAHEFLGLRKRDIHLDRSPGYEWGWAIARSTKTGDRALSTTDDRTIPLIERSAAILRRRLSASDLLFNLGKARMKTRINRVDRYIWLACKAAGIPYGRKTENGLTLHDTRHTVISRLLQNGHDLGTVMDIVGHKNPATTLGIYSHATARSRAAAMASLSRVPSVADSTSDQVATGGSGEKAETPNP